MDTKIRLYIGHRLSERFHLQTEGLDKKYQEVNDAWKKKEKTILKGLNQVTGLSFLQNYINVYLIDPTKTYSISNPTIVATKGNKNRIIRTIVHELIHTLIWDNVQRVDWYKTAEKIWEQEEPLTIVHIVIHSILESVYRDILKNPEEIEKDIKECQQWNEYKRAWEIVKKEGYQNIIDKLKK